MVQMFKYFCNFFVLTDADKNQQGFKADERSIRVIGFVPKEKIPKNKILGDGNMVFFPTEGDVVSTKYVENIHKCCLWLF